MEKIHIQYCRPYFVEPDPEQYGGAALDLGATANHVANK
jgi:hypothetical protein